MFRLMQTKWHLLLSMVCWFIMGCDESTKATVLTGVESGLQTIVTSLLTAAFQTINTGTTGI